jgi:hypothetical protein
MQHRFRTARPARGGQRVERQRQQGVAGEDRSARAEHRPGRGAMAAQHVAIDDVVVKQREVVHELDSNRRGQGQLAGAAAGLGRE